MKTNAPEKIYILPHKDYSDKRIMNIFTEKRGVKGGVEKFIKIKVKK